MLDHPPSRTPELASAYTPTGEHIKFVIYYHMFLSPDHRQTTRAPAPNVAGSLASDGSHHPPGQVPSERERRPAQDPPSRPAEDADGEGRCRHDELPLIGDIRRLLVQAAASPSVARTQRGISVSDGPVSTGFGRGRNARIPGLVNKPPSAPGTPSRSGW